MDQQISLSAVSEYLDCVQRAGVLGKSARRVKLLEYIIDKERNGDGESLKAYSIGIDVLDRADDFDPTTDSSVRVEMGRLRTALAAFESSDAATCALTVEIPVGSYRPQITQRAMVPAPQPDATVAATKTGTNSRKGLFAALVAVLFAVTAIWFIQQNQTGRDANRSAVIVAIMPFTGDAVQTAQIEAALRRSLVRSRTIATQSQNGPSAERPDFVLRGLVSTLDAGTSRVDVELLNEAIKQVVWAKSLVLDEGDDIDQRVTQAISSELKIRLLGASKEFLEGRDPARLTPEQLFVMATWVPGPATNAVEWELERIALMELALAQNPDHGAAHSVMADKLTYLANVDAAANTEDLRARAVMHADRALELEALNPDAMFNVAQSHWHAGRITQSRITMQRVLDLDPGHNLALFLSKVIPYTCAPPPPNVIAEAVAFDNTLSPDNPIRWLTLTWIAWLHLNNGDYERALEAEEQAALIFEIPYTFMRHAVLLNELGRPDEAAEIIRRQKTNWPDISPDHFANVTLPRLCSENPQGQNYIAHYERLAAAMAGRL